MPQLRLSVILATYNRADSLRRAIDALLHQSAGRDSYEVIVVDNNCSDGTAALLDSIDDPRLRAIREPRQGLSYARNAGLAAARSDIVAFTDDDVEAAADWAETIISSLDARPEVDGAGGRVMPVWDREQPGWLTQAHWAPLALQDHGDHERIFDRDTPIGLVGANVAFRRSVFDRVGRFSPDVQRVKDGIGSTEDHELLLRLYASGGRLLYLPRMLVMARVQAHRYDRDYHRRWHEGHGHFHAIMRAADMERSRLALLGIPSHLIRRAAHDLGAWLKSAVAADWDRAFAAELRLRFFRGFVLKRLARP
jgi:glycosyltransferase involved in cell wall biosynthesis